jgi:hypothetical protein
LQRIFSNCIALARGDQIQQGPVPINIYRYAYALINSLGTVDDEWIKNKTVSDQNVADC